MTSTLSQSLHRGLLELQDQGLLCDVTLVGADGQKVRAHAAVLAAVSQYFRARLTGPWSTASSETQVIKLEQFSGQVLQFAVKAMYASDTDYPRLFQEFCKQPDGSLDIAKAEGALQACSFFDVTPSMQWGCEQCISAHIQLENCIELLALAAKMDAAALLRNTGLHTACNFRSIMDTDQKHQLAGLPSETLYDLLCHRQVHHCCSAGGSSAKILEAIKIWLEAEPEGRAAELGSVLQALHMRPSELISLLEPLVPQCSSSAAAAAIDGVIRNLWVDVETEPSFCTAPRDSLHTGLLACGGRDGAWLSIRMTEVYDVARDTWQSASTLPCDMAFAGSAEIPEGVCVVGGGAWRTTVCVYDSAACAWRRRNPMHVSRIHSATASIGEHVFVMGGRTMTDHNCSMEISSMERFSTAKDEWSPAADMLSPRQCHGAAALGGTLYIVGGQCGKWVYSGVDCYDPATDRWWRLPANMQSKRKYMSLTVHDARLVAIGGMTSERKRLATVEAMDPREGNTWVSLPPMSMARSSCGVASLGGQLFAVGGTSSSEDRPLASVEAYVSTAGKWISKAHLLRDRTSHTVAAIF